MHPLGSRLNLQERVSVKYLKLITFSIMFGGGAGHIFDMIARNKANQDLCKNKSRFHKDFFKFDHEMSAKRQNLI
jgi:hypothetical protein